MLPAVVVAAALLVLVAVGAYASWLGSRLDRLGLRVASARAHLEAQLVRRAAAAAELAPLLPAGDPRDLLTEAAAAAGRPVREPAESTLTRAIRQVLAAPGAAAAGLVDELAATVARVQLARQLHNDTVHALRTLRGRRLVRLLRLGSRREPPAYVEFDDGRS